MKKKLHYLFLCILIGMQLQSLAAGTVSGTLQKWHKITIDFTGPQTGEANGNNPFLNYRLDVTFTNGAKTYIVPGFFAADGNAGQTGATSGNVWRVNFAPDATGTWTYSADFRKGTNVAVADNPSAFATDGSIHGNTGTFNISETNKTGRDMRAKGCLRYVNKHHLQFAGSGEYFMKAGPDSPENLLAYHDIDNTGGNNGLMKDWQPHVADWKNGDPTWGANKGKGLIGALNYLASENMNAISFLTMNSPIGDDKNVFPWIDKNKQTQYDCSKLDQWEIIFSHAQQKGLFLHFKTQETENELVLDNGAVGTERKLYYRELIARFAHHNALEWNICEEGGAGFSNTNQTQEQRRQSIAFFADNDPYGHNVVVHTAPGLNSQKQIYDAFLGNGSKLTGVSLQNHWDDVFETTQHWVQASDNNSRKWVVANDEQGNAQIGVPHDNYTGTPTKEDIRKQTLWGNLMAGGAGVNYYFGYGQPNGNQVDILFNNSDLRCEDFRSRDISWDYARYGLSFFDLYLPFWEMHNDDSKTSNNNSHCLLKDGDVYVIYLRNGGTSNVSLPAGTYNVDWYNPRTGGALTPGTRNLSGGGSKGIGNPPGADDWVALIRNINFTHNSQWGNGFSVPNPDLVASITLSENLVVLPTLGQTQQLTATVLPSSAVNKTVSWTSSDENIATVSSNGTITAIGNGRATITASSTDGSNKSASADVVVGISNCDEYTYGPNWIVFEADITNSDLDKWAKRTPAYNKYMAGTGQLPIGNDYLEFTGNNENGGTATSPLVYKFTAPKTGKYRLGMRLLQNLEGAEWDKSNDVYIKMAGNFTTGNIFSTDDLKHDHKFYGRGKDNWGAGINMEGHVDGVKKLVPVFYNFIAGEEYTFTMSGRAQRTCIDYIIFYETTISYTIGEEKDIAALNPDTYWPSVDCDGQPDVCSEIKAVDFDKFTGIAGFTNATTDNKDGKDILQIANRDAIAAAQYTYTGSNADVFFKINAMQEIDGEPTYILKVNNIEIGRGTNDRIYGTNTPDYTIQTHNINTSAYALKNGDLIQIEFNNHTNGLVPEGELTATARGRWYSLEICTTGGNSNTPVTGIVQLQATAEVDMGSTISLITSVLPANATNQVISWSSEDPSTATVNSNGIVSGVAVGTVEITATTADGGFTTSTLVTVNKVNVVNVSPIHDAYLQGTTRFNSADLRVENGNRVTYLQFDLSLISGEIEGMDLELTVGSDAGNGTVNILDGSHSNWTETNLSTGNAPNQGSQLDQSTGALAAGQTYSYDVSNVSVIGDKLTVIVTMNAGGNDVSFASKENQNVAKPNLKVRLKDTVTGIIDSKEAVITVFPNPTTGVAHLSNALDWELFSLQGMPIKSGNGKLVDLSNLVNGVYLLKTVDGYTRISKN